MELSWLGQEVTAKGKAPQRKIPEQRDPVRRALARAEIDSTGTVTTAKPMVIGQPSANTWTWRWQAKGKGHKGKRKGKGKGLYFTGSTEETGDIADHQEKEKSEQQSEGTADDTWWLGSMSALTRELRMRGVSHLQRALPKCLQFWRGLATQQTLPRTQACNIGREREGQLEGGSRMVLGHPCATRPTLDEGGGDPIGVCVCCCQGYSKNGIPHGGGCGRLGS